GLQSCCDPVERFQLASDAWATTVAGSTGLEEWAAVARAISDDDDPDVWAALSGMLAVLRGLATEDDCRALRGFAAELGTRAWARLGWEPRGDESPRAATARARVLGVLGLTAEDPALRSEAADRFRRHLADGEGLTPDLVGPVARIVVAAGGVAEWERALGQ